MGNFPVRGFGRWEMAENKAKSRFWHIIFGFNPKITPHQSVVLLSVRYGATSPIVFGEVTGAASPILFGEVASLSFSFLATFGGFFRRFGCFWLRLAGHDLFTFFICL